MELHMLGVKTFELGWYIIYRRNFAVNLHIVNYVFWEVCMVDMVVNGIKHMEVV
jgi:hypothetical protein